MARYPDALESDGEWADYGGQPGAVLLSRMMPQKHAALVDASDDRFVIDLMKIKALAKNPFLPRVLAALSFVRVSGTRVDGENLLLELDVSPLAAPSAST